MSNKIIELLGSHLVDKDFNSVPTAEALEGVKAIALYFSAHWCPPCRAFSNGVIGPYLKDEVDGFKVIFVSRDRSSDAMQGYMQETLQTYAVPYDSQERNSLPGTYNVRGIPTMIVLNAETGETVSNNGRMEMTNDTKGAIANWISQC
ncbi:hypothetical protein PCE1_000557 [Barthelona sp. PCE]